MWLTAAAFNGELPWTGGERKSITGMKIMTSMTRDAGKRTSEHRGRRGAGPGPRVAGDAGATSALLPLALALLTACGGSDAGSSGSGAAADQAGATEETRGAAADAFVIDPALLPEGVTVAMVEEGRELFSGGGVCHTCHMEDATGGPLGPDLTDDTWLNVDGEYESIVEVINTGVAQPIEALGSMLPRAGMPLTDEQVEALAAYAYMLSRM